MQIYKRAAKTARMAAAPPTATELRLAALPVGEAVGKAVVGTAVVALDDGVATTVVVMLEAVVGTTTVTDVVVIMVVEVVETSVVTGTDDEEEEEVDAAADVVAEGMVKVTPNWAQRP